MIPPATIERDLKLSVWPGYTLPDVSDVLDGARAGTAPDRR